MAEELSYIPEDVIRSSQEQKGTEGSPENLKRINNGDRVLDRDIAETIAKIDMGLEEGKIKSRSRLLEKIGDFLQMVPGSFLYLYGSHQMLRDPNIVDDPKKLVAAATITLLGMAGSAAVVWKVKEREDFRDRARRGEIK